MSAVLAFIRRLARAARQRHDTAQVAVAFLGIVHHARRPCGSECDAARASLCRSASRRHGRAPALKDVQFHDSLSGRRGTYTEAHGGQDTPTPYNVVQSTTDLVIAIKFALVQMLRSGDIGGQKFDKIVGVPHGYGSVQAITAHVPPALHAALLPGFSRTPPDNAALLAEYEQRRRTTGFHSAPTRRTHRMQLASAAHTRLHGRDTSNSTSPRSSARSYLDSCTARSQRNSVPTS
ncbi:uncharacterized protein C8Q71DRAFT_443909 [Rhodofomes roseus]|uniref:Uncharacterized protein n=1 Tax=Rhodofomes roseus TaxID=34475 RepID=A0ABQ8JYC3_9APHY|nr:uncharacterized protein C8Q71DRAFT_443909 [Rhodofomes roseus]KAH9829242.1 hypothetical protein C8Q71DRAFT_443909 [Rhodofomes roseus]